MKKEEQILIKFFSSVLDGSKMDPMVFQFLAKRSTRLDCPKKTELSKQGLNHASIFIMERGMARRYTLIDGKDITLAFAQENEMIMSEYAVITGDPTQDYIETLEDSSVLRVSSQDIQHLYHVSEDAHKIGTLLRNNYLVHLEHRVQSLQIYSASERYQKFIAEKPEIIQRASLGQIASYLGMSQETLSRIRSKK